MITDLKKPDILSIAQCEGIALKQRGRYYWGLCPLPGHTEKTPSFKVDPETGYFHCYGCSASGDVIEFIERLKGISFKEALKYLRIEGKKPYLPDPIELHKKELIADFQVWCRSYFTLLCDRLIRLNRIKQQLKTEAQVEAYAVAYHAESIWTMQVEILQSRDNKAKLELYQEVIRES